MALAAHPAHTSGHGELGERIPHLIAQGAHPAHVRCAESCGNVGAVAVSSSAGGGQAVVGNGGLAHGESFRNEWDSTLTPIAGDTGTPLEVGK